MAEFSPFAVNRGAVTSSGGSPLYNIDPAVIAALQPRAIYGQTENDFGALLGYDNTLRFTDNGTDYIADFDGDAVRIQPYIDTGGGWLGNHHLDRYNGVGYDIYGGSDRAFKGGGTWDGLTGAPGSWAALATAIGGPLLGAGLAGAAGAGTVGGATAANTAWVPTAAEAAAGSSAFMESMTPYLASGATTTGSLMGPLTEAQTAAQMQTLQAELAPYLSSGSPIPSSLMDKAKTLTSSMPGGMGGLSTLAGGLLGSQGQSNDASVTRSLPSYLQGPVAGDLIPRTQGLLSSQMGLASDAGADMIAKGRWLQSAPVAWNGVDQVKLNAPNTPTNPYATGILDDMQRRSEEVLGKGLLSAKGNFVGSGSLGGSRQGILESEAIKGVADNLAGQGFNFMGGLYNADQNRALQQYGMDQNFYGQQRGQDLTQMGIGAALQQQGFQTQFAPINSAANAYSPFSGFGQTTQNTNQGGGWQGVAGGLLGGAQFAKNAGWW